MGLRGKLAFVFATLLIVAVIATSALEFERAIRLMVTSLGDSGVSLTDQIFEQMRAALNHSRGDPIHVLQSDPAVAASLESAQAFTRGVVYVRIEEPDGELIVGTPLGIRDSDNVTVKPFDELWGQVHGWWPTARLAALWGDRVYEITRPVEISGRPFAVIKLGLSTALIQQEIHASMRSIAAIACIGIVLAMICGALASAVLLRPVAKIASGVEQLASGSEEVKFKVAASDEFGGLAEKFNQLSQRIRSDRAAWETERGQFLNIFRSITDALLLLDRHGSILFANGEAQTRLGLPADGMANGKPLSLLLGHDHPLTRMIENAYIVGSEVRDVALELGQGLKAVRVLVSIFSLGRGPEPPGFLVIVRDLDPVRELEHVVDYSGRLARLGGLISGVAHQIRNPLNAMSLQLELLSEDAAQGKPVEERLMQVRGEITRLDAAIAALLRFMRPEELKVEEINLEGLLREVGREVVRPGIMVHYDLEFAAPPLYGDRALLGEALRNVAKNAVDATRNGGALTFQTRTPNEGFIQISIIDQGEGIAAEHLSNIFDLYYTTKETGSGLGLSLALRAVDLHYGTIEVQSSLGVGTTVKVNLPTGDALAHQKQNSGAPLN